MVGITDGATLQKARAARALHKFTSTLLRSCSTHLGSCLGIRVEGVGVAGTISIAREADRGTKSGQGAVKQTAQASVTSMALSQEWAV